MIFKEIFKPWRHREIHSRNLKFTIHVISLMGRFNLVRYHENAIFIDHFLPMLFWNPHFHQDVVLLILKFHYFLVILFVETLQSSLKFWSQIHFRIYLFPFAQHSNLWNKSRGYVWLWESSSTQIPWWAERGKRKYEILLHTWPVLPRWAWCPFHSPVLSVSLCNAGCSLEVVGPLYQDSCYQGVK